MNVRLAIWLTVVTAVAIAAFVGAWQLSDETALPLRRIITIGWLIGMATVLLSTYWGRLPPGYRWTMRAHLGVIAQIAIITCIAAIANSGLRNGDFAAWPTWLIVSGVLLGIVFFQHWFPYGPHSRAFWTISELSVVAGLSAGALAAIWLLNGHTDRLPWVIAGAWLLGVIYLFEVGRDF